ncbi:hypothetical protein B0H19DRAFT_295029 [Mycena capillaripes]|nr:hypothetical protein B0H19DRAFT_295029 [Mycena capillaripes]
MAEIFLRLTAIGGLSLPRYDSQRIFADKATVRPRRHRARLIFGEVSRRWRTIALSIPQLWNSISLDCRNRNIQKNVSLCDTWLKRSASLPLSICFYRDCTFSAETAKKDTRDSCQYLIRTILPYAERWRLLYLEGFPPSSYDVILGLNSVPILETLFLSYDRRSTVT